MSRTAHKLLSASGAKGYEVDQSLMFNVGDSSYLSRDYGTGANSYRKWTFSTWIKFDSNNNTGSSSSGGSIWTSWDNSTQSDTSYGWIGVYQDGLQVGGWNTNWRVTNRKFRDVSAWMHLVVAVDTTIADGSADNRIRIYINGVEETSFSTKNNPSQNTELPWNKNQQHRLGAINSSTPYYMGAYLAETQVIDGSQLTPSSFGETDAVTGQWIPKKYTGTYPAYSFYLKYVSGAIGTDSSGNGNNYTANNLANADVMLDTPTNNFSTLNSIQAYNTTTGVLTQGNLRIAAGTYDSGHYSNISSTFNVPSSGKWYAECRVGISVGGGNVAVFGVTDQDIDWSGVANENLTGMDGFFTSLYGDYIKVVDSGTIGTGNTSATATSYILGMALDVDNGYAYFGVDSGSAMVWYKADGSTSGGDPTSGSTGTGGFARTFTINDTITVSVSIPAPGYTSNGSLNILNFGQNGTFSGTETAGGNTDGNGYGNFFRAPPSGYLALCSKNLPTPAVKKSSEHFNTLLYTGNDADDRTLTGVGFQPDLVWIKPRNTASNNHNLFDAVRGVSKRIFSNSNSVEYSDSDPNNSLVAFTSDGFTVDDSSGHSDINSSSHTYVAWNWKAGGSGSANTDGSINTTATSVNTTAGISISNYQGTGSNATVGHGLGVAPKTIWIKNRDTDDNWRIYFGDNTDYMAFNWTGGGTDDNTAWNDTSPTSTVFSIGTDTNTNRSGDDFIAYCFAEVDGFSRFGTYEGNNNANGPFIHTGFRPAWIVFKYIDNNDESWWMIDNKRDLLNPNTINLFVNLLGADYDAGGVDILSNGFKPRATNGGLNGYTGTFFYMAFAEAPFKYANAQ